MAFASGIPDVTELLRQIGTVMTAIGGEGGLVANVAALTGGFFIIQAAFRAYGLADNVHKRGEGGVMSILSPIFFGTILINFWMSQQQVADQLALTGGVLSPALPSQYLQQMWAALKVVLNGFGAITLFRGFLLAKAAGDGTAHGHQSPAWAAFWHVTGGVLLMKI